MINDNKIDLFEATVLSFTIYILFSLIYQLTPINNKEIIKLLEFFDFIACCIFLVDWFGRLKHSHNKKKFALWNLPDLVASLPFLFIFDYVGFIKGLRIIRLIKVFGSINRIVFYLKTNKIDTIRLSFTISFILIMIASPILILHVEHSTGNIKTAEQALWWTYCTLTTIGYGDFYPTTNIGRGLAILISIGGISLFGIVSSFVINLIKTENEKSIHQSSE